MSDTEVSAAIPTVVSAMVSGCNGESCTPAAPTSVVNSISDPLSTPSPTSDISSGGSSTRPLVTTHITSTVMPSMVVVTVTSPLNPSPTLEIDPTATDSATSDNVHQSNDTRVVAITIGVVGGLALLILLLYWAVNYLASRRYQDEEEYIRDRDLEGESATSMLGAASKTERDTPLPGRPILSRPKRASLIPYARKAVTFERLSRSSYPNNNNTKHFSDLLAKRVSAVHPGTKVLFGSPATKASKIVPPRKPVPRAAGHPTPAQPRPYVPSGTESDYSDDADDVSTVLGGTGKSQQQIQQEAAYHPLPPGVPFAKWLNAGRAQELPTSNSRPTSTWQR